jgi:hypothetical protein
MGHFIALLVAFCFGTLFGFILGVVLAMGNKKE